MSYVHHPALRCPLDQLPLQHVGKCLCCDNGHSFDIARQGYVNVLSAQDKRSRDPGDSKGMVAARRDFLQAGYFLPLATKVAALAQPLLGEDALLVDAGCGEGYYLQQLAQALDTAGRRRPAIIGFDISKWALQVAARRFPATWLVASNRHIPLASASADLVLSLFGFPDYASFQRILTAGGHVILAYAGPRHLLELREVIYPEVQQAQSREQQRAEAAGFSLCDSCTVQFTTPALDQQTIARLLCMTPHFFRAGAEGKLRAAALQDLPVSVDVILQVLRAPNPSHP